MSEEILNESKARLEDVLAPINGGVGDDVSYDDKFEAIKLEIDKLSSLTGDSCNWTNVAAMSEELLQEKSKDFRIGCYLACCKMREGRLDKVLDGLMILSEMCARYWEGMYPPLRRIRARAGMIGWMSDQAGEAVGTVKLTAADGAMVKAIDTLSSTLDGDFRAKFADAYPGMTALREGIKNLVRTVPKEAPPPPPPPPPASARQEEVSAPEVYTPDGDETPAQPPMVYQSGGGGDGATAASVQTADDARSAMEPTWRLLVKMGSVLRAEKPENPLCYKLSRLGMWAELTALPAVENGLTLVPPPEAYVRGRIEGLIATEEWLALLNDADDTGSENILWLDTQRYVSTAMSAMGAMFMKAREELLLQVALMLRRVPLLPTMLFNDGTPYADAQTQMWIENEVKPVLASRGGGATVASVLDEPIKEARNFAMKGDLGKAIEVVSAASDAAPTPVDRFRGKLAIAQLCLGAGRLAIARSQLEGLTEVIRKHELAKWDPRLCGEVYAALYSAHRGLNVGEAVAPEAYAAETAAFEQLCQLDPAAALKLAPKA